MQAQGAAGGRPSEAVSPEWTPREMGWLVLLVLGAALVRALRWHGTSLLFNDGPTFLALARLMGAGGWVEALLHPYHPLFPFLTLLAHLLGPDWETSAATISVVAGAGSVFCLFVFLRAAFGRSAAWVGAAFLALQPRAVSYSADVQSDGLYLALFLAGVALLWVAAQRSTRALAGWAGVFAGLAYLTRPEGAGILIVGAAWALGCVLRRQWSPGRAAGWVIVLFAAALLTMLPYLTFLRVERGSWMVTQKKSVGRLLSGDGDAAVSVHRTLGSGASLLPEASAWPLVPQQSDLRVAPEARIQGRPLAAAGEVLAAVSSAVRPWFLALLVAGAFVRRGRPGPAAAFVLLFLALYGVVLFHLDYRYAYVDARHALPPMVLTFGYLAPGCGLLGRVLLSGVARIRATAALPSPERALAAGAGLVLLVALGGSMLPERAGAAADREAATWLRTQGTEPGAVAATKGRLAYYAGRSYVSLYTLSPSGLIDRMRERGARYVIVDDQKLAEFPELAKAQGNELRLVYRAEDRGRSTGVYEVVPGSLGPAASPPPGAPPASPAVGAP